MQNGPPKAGLSGEIDKGGVYPQRTAQSIRGPFFSIYYSLPLPLIAFFSFIFSFSFSFRFLKLLEIPISLLVTPLAFFIVAFEPL